jgi:hypothetical protein
VCREAKTHVYLPLGATNSMSRKGDCWDHSVAESFFATIKGEMIDHDDYETRAEAIAAIADYIDGFYNVTGEAGDLHDRQLPTLFRCRCEMAFPVPCSRSRLSRGVGRPKSRLKFSAAVTAKVVGKPQTRSHLATKRQGKGCFMKMS